MRKSLVRSSLLWTIVLVLANACGGGQKPLEPVNDGQIIQKGSALALSHRLYLKNTVDGKYNYLGRGEVDTYEVINPRSIPDHSRHLYLVIELLDAKGRIIHSQFISNQLYGTSPRSDFYLYHYVFDFFVDIPIHIDISHIHELKFSDLSHTERQRVKLDPALIYQAPADIDDGWDGQLYTLLLHGDKDSSEAFDLVVLGDGFISEEMDISSDEALKESLFGKKVQEYIDYLFTTPPYKEMKEHINVWLVATPSKESGASIPSEGIHKKTTFSATFDAFCTRRAVIIQKQARVLEMANHVPFDQVIVLINSSEYGGIGSDIATFTLHPQSPGVFVHELGHSIGMLADEYSYFSDDQVQNACPDHLVREQVYHRERIWGRNGLYEANNSLAPNLTLHPSKAPAKWLHLLKKTSPIVYFDYGLKAFEFSTATGKLKGEFKLQARRDKLYFLFGSSMTSNPYLTQNTASIVLENKTKGKRVQGQTRLIRAGNKQSLVFIEMDLDFEADAGDILSVEMNLNLPVHYHAWIEHQLSNRNFLTLASMPFNPDEIGLFQGAAPSLTEVFRPHFCSYMMSSECAMSDYQIQTTKAILGRFLGTQNMKAQER